MTTEKSIQEILIKIKEILDDTPEQNLSNLSQEIAEEHDAVLRKIYKIISGKL